MNDTPIKNILKYTFSFVFFYSGILRALLNKYIKNGLFVFNYHNFNSFTNDYWKFGSIFCSKYQQNFRRQMLFLLSLFERSTEVSNAAFKMESPYFLVTFDDGYKDNKTIALPVLKQLHVPTVFFIATDYIGSRELLWHDKVRLYYEHKSGGFFKNISTKKKCKEHIKQLKTLSHAHFSDSIQELSQELDDQQSLMMTWEDIKEAHASGVVIAPHTTKHSILSNLSPQEKKESIVNSIQAIKDTLHFDPFLFCYPDGSPQSFDDEVLSILKNNGIKYAFTTTNGFNRDLSDPLKLRRIGVNPSDPVPVLALKILRTLRSADGEARC